MSKHLYHGSGYKQDELKPGVLRSGQIARWDGTESNEWLYVTTCRESAIAQGLASVLEKNHGLVKFHHHGDRVSVTVKGHGLCEEDIHHCVVYLYTIDHHPSHGWTEVSNLTNGITTEYKTKEVIPPEWIDSCDLVDMRQWLKGKVLSIVKIPSSHQW